MKVYNVNINGALFTVQAAGQQMEKFDSGGSLILIASISGSIANKVWISFGLDNTLSFPPYALLMLIFRVGQRWCELQLVQVSSVTNGAEHGLRVGSQTNSSEYD